MVETLTLLAYYVKSFLEVVSRTVSRSLLYTRFLLKGPVSSENRNEETGPEGPEDNQARSRHNPTGPFSGQPSPKKTQSYRSLQWCTEVSTSYVPIPL